MQDSGLTTALHVNHLHNEISLSLSELHLLLKSGAKGIKGVSSRGSL